MLLPSIRRLALADLDEETLRELVAHGEDLLVERKQALPKPPGFGAAASSFANRLGGWILLGVADDKTLHGYPNPANLDLQSHLASVLRKECDPLPPFVADVRELDGKSLAVLRVFESTDPPHIVRGTGAVYVRSSKGKEPVDDHRTLLELARRGTEAEAEARARLVGQPLIKAQLAPPDLDPRQVARSPDEQHVVVHVRAAPLTVTPQFADWPISGRDGGVRACVAAADHLLPTERGHPQVAAAARGAIARKSVPPDLLRGAMHALVVADSGGVVAASLKRHTEEGDWVSPDSLHRELIRPLLYAIVRMLSSAEAYGRAAFDTWVCVPGNVIIEDSRLRRGAGTASEVHMSGELTIPADDDEVGALGAQWEREFARNVGITRWED